MLRQFAQKIEDLRRLIDDSRSASFLLAVSGGMDSMCLLDIFSRTLQPSEYAVAHCNFSLRAEESDGDQALVEARAAELGVRVFVRRFDTEAYAAEKGISIEMAARDLRYGWFLQLCRAHGFGALAVAHNANDNAETLVLNLLRGTGLNGLHAMTEVSVCQERQSEGTVTLFRPLLGFTRKQIEGYVLTHRVAYRHDSSNFTSDYKRNRIRNEVFPLFEKINPSFVRTLNREAGYFAEAGSIVEEWCRSKMQDVISHDGASSVTIRTKALLADPHWRYLLYYILQPYGFSSQTLASIESLLDSDRTVSGKRFSSHAYMLLTTRDSLMVFESDCRPSSDVCPAAGKALTLSDEVMVVRGAGLYDFNGRRFQVETIEWSESQPLRQPEGTLIMDASILSFPFVCRRWRQGDWFIPLGMRGRKKVSDLFADLKYNAFEKDSAVMIVDTCADALAGEQHLAGILGVRIDGRYKVTADTRTVIKITVL